MITNGNSIQVSQSQFVERLFNDDSFVKVAEETFSAFIQSKIHESGFMRKILKPTHVTQADLHTAAGSNTEGHYMLRKDVDARAMAVSLLGRGEHRYYTTESELISFQNIASDKLSKSKWEMMTGDVDYQKIFKERISQQMFQVEDQTLLNLARYIFAKELAEYTAEHGSLTTSGNMVYSDQTITFTGDETMDKNNLVTFNQMSTKRRIRPSKYLLTETLLQELMKLTQQDVGDSVVSELFKKGARLLFF